MALIIPSGKRYWKIAATGACLALMAAIGVEVHRHPLDTAIISEPRAWQLGILLDRDDWVYLSTVVFLTSGTSASAPGDWNASDNKIECIGGGSGGDLGFGAGGGGAYASVTNQAWTGSISIQIGAGAAIDVVGGDTWWKTTGTVKAAGANKTQGGAVADCVGSTKFKGGDFSASGVGAGGAGGPNGAGQDGFTDKSGEHGGAGDNGSGGAATTDSANGNPGAEWTATAGGTAGSGSGAVDSAFSTPRTGGLYGGGGSGGGAGAQGIIVYTYTPSGGAFQWYPMDDSGSETTKLIRVRTEIITDDA